MALSQKLIRVIDDQVVFLFTGRISVVDRNSRKNILVIKIFDGEIIYVKYQLKEGIVALESSLVDFNSCSEDDVIIKIEPEEIEENIRNIFFSYTNLLEKLNLILDKNIQLKKLRPSMGMKFSLAESFFSKVEETYLTSKDFDVIREVVKTSNIKKIYQAINLSEGDVTESLIKLKNAGLLRVLN